LKTKGRVYRGRSNERLQENPVLEGKLKKKDVKDRL
jgi:hypothetical protein